MNYIQKMMLTLLAMLPVDINLGGWCKNVN